PRDQGYREHLAMISDEEHLAWMVLRAFLKRIMDVANWTQFQSMAIVFERNPRSKHLLQSAFSGISIEEAGRRLPIEFFEMEKRVGEPGLEAADFVANTLAGHARWLLVDRKPGFRRDYQAVFQSVGPRLASVMAITSIDYTPALAPDLPIGT
ncbi:MAG TPA: hypothetical protein VJX94_23535, partial [Stellaceae bacterium]|nr:hypothetical protein [Stellaceae bacterium]